MGCFSHAIHPTCFLYLLDEGASQTLPCTRGDNYSSALGILDCQSFRLRSPMEYEIRRSSTGRVLGPLLLLWSQHTDTKVSSHSGDDASNLSRTLQRYRI